MTPSFALKKGTRITQGTASGTVAATSPIHFTNLACPNCVNTSYFFPKSNCDCSGSCQTSNYKAPTYNAIYENGVLVEQPGTGAKGIIYGGYGEDMYVILTSTTNFALNGGNLFLNTPTDNEKWKYKKVSGSIALSGSTQIIQTGTQIIWVPV